MILEDPDRWNMEVLTPRNIYFILVCCLLITSHCSYAMERIHDGQEPQCYSRFDYEYKVIQKLVQLEEWKKELSETVEAQRETTAAQEAEIKSLSDKLGASDQSLKETISSQKELRETTKTQRETITAQEAEIKSLFDKLGESDQSLKETISSLEDAKTKINEMSRNRGNNNMTGKLICQIRRLSRLMTKPTKWHVRPAKTQISLDIRPV